MTSSIFTNNAEVQNLPLATQPKKKQGRDLNHALAASGLNQVAPKDHTGALRCAHRTSFSWSGVPLGALLAHLTQENHGVSELSLADGTDSTSLRTLLPCGSDTVILFEGGGGGDKQP